jgi:hypothetical protein
MKEDAGSTRTTRASDGRSARGDGAERAGKREALGALVDLDLQRCATNEA